MLGRGEGRREGGREGYEGCNWGGSGEESEREGVEES